MSDHTPTIVQVLPALESGGVERGTLEIGRAIVQAGWRSVVVSGGGRLVGQLQAEGSEHVTWDLGRKSVVTLRHIRPFRRLSSRTQARRPSCSFAYARVDGMDGLAACLKMIVPVS